MNVVIIVVCSAQVCIENLFSHRMVYAYIGKTKTKTTNGKCFHSLVWKINKFNELSSTNPQIHINFHNDGICPFISSYACTSSVELQRKNIYQNQISWQLQLNLFLVDFCCTVFAPKLWFFLCSVDNVFVYAHCNLIAIKILMSFVYLNDFCGIELFSLTHTHTHTHGYYQRKLFLQNGWKKSNRQRRLFFTFLRLPLANNLTHFNQSSMAFKSLCPYPNANNDHHSK